MDIEQASSAFLDHCARERGLSKNTLDAYRQDLREFRAFVGKLPVDELDGEGLVAFSSHLSRCRGLAPATVKRRLACLKSMFAWLLRRRLIPSNPFSTVELRVRLPDRLPRCVAAADMAALVAAARSACDLSRLATLLLFATGVRVGELTAIRLADVDVLQGSIRIRGKGDRERYVYIPDHVTRAVLDAYVRDRRTQAPDTGHLLRGRDGASVSSAAVRRRLRDLSARARLRTRVTPHMLRHTAATSLIEAGVDMRFVQRLLGHKSIATTQIYTHVSDRALQDAICRADTVGRLLSIAA